MAIDKDRPIVIERVANGYQVYPFGGPNELIIVKNIFVFQDMGYAIAGENQPVEKTLLGYIAQHFADPDLKS